MARTVKCIKLETEAEGLDFPPYPGDLANAFGKTSAKKLGLPGLSIKPCWSMKTA